MSDTQVKFAPFGIGIHSMDSDKAKEIGSRAVEAGKTACFFTLGMAVIAGEVALRLTANGLTHAANTVADTHAGYVKHVQSSGRLQKAILTVQPQQAAK